MAELPSVKLSQKLRKPVRAKIQDDLIMGTNNSSIVSKRSVERLYFTGEPHFFRYFVKKPQRRSPLINRGYWLRMKAIDHVVRQFLEESSEKHKVVVNLGCGYDPLPWQCLSRYPTACQNTTFVDVDYRDLMLRKCEMVQHTSELSSMLTNIDIPASGDILFRSNQYLQIACDLRDLERLNRLMASALDLQNCVVLLAAEVSITYMDVEAADNLIKWANTFPVARFCLLEQLLPEGIKHPFASTMMAHFDKLNTPLGAVQKYPTTHAQRCRFEALGWPHVSVRNLWELWNSADFLSTNDRRQLDLIEPFDEYEEFALFGSHYFLLVASNQNTHMHASAVSSQSLEIVKELQKIEPIEPSAKIEMEILFTPSSTKSNGCRRFAAGLPLRGSHRDQTLIGNFGGMGLKTRMDSYDVYATVTGESEARPRAQGPPAHPLSRMSHTITDLGDFGALLVGGRTSPDNSLADCWLYHKWVDIWERVDDLPQPLYRHEVADLGKGYALISTGRINSQNISNHYFVWSRCFGWVKCHIEGGNLPTKTYGATFAPYPISDQKTSEVRCGILAGGISEDAVLEQAVWEWDLQNFKTKKPILSFRPSSSSSNLARFGASIVNIEHEVFIVGGIIKDRLLRESEEVCTLNSQNVNLSYNLGQSTPRPLLIGSTAVAIDGNSFLVMGGGAVCFSFGTYWNKSCFTFSLADQAHDSQTKNSAKSVGICNSQITSPHSADTKIDALRNIASSQLWCCVHTISPQTPLLVVENTAANPREPDQAPIPITRVKIHSSEDFNNILRKGTPIILEGLDIGSCSKTWTASYLKDKIGRDREVIVHRCTTENMNFKTKNYSYISKTFGDFFDEIEGGEKLYLRSLSSDNAKEIPANLETDFPSIAADFKLPKELSFVLQNLHSSPLRISGPVNMWLHYDVMANVLCQIQGQKRLLVFPPADVIHFEFEPGASSSSINVFESQALAGTSPYEALLREGDILFLPSLWLHAASPTSGISIAVNAFFRDLQNGYAVGRDVYGNRDLQAYEKGRQDIARITKSFDNLPKNVARFYLSRLVYEFQQKSSSP